MTTKFSFPSIYLIFFVIIFAGHVFFYFCPSLTHTRTQLPSTRFPLSRKHVGLIYTIANFYFFMVSSGMFMRFVCNYGGGIGFLWKFGWAAAAVAGRSPRWKLFIILIKFKIEFKYLFAISLRMIFNYNSARLYLKLIKINQIYEILINNKTD